MKMKEIGRGASQAPLPLDPPMRLFDYQQSDRLKHFQFQVCRVIVPFSPTASAESWSVEAFSLWVFTLLLPKSPSGPPWNEGHRPKFITRPVYLRSQFRNNTNTVSSLVLLIHLLQVLCTRYAGIAHHRALQTSGRGWAGSKAVHGMECSGACSLYWRSLSAGAAA